MKTISSTLGIALLSCCAFSLSAHAATGTEKAQRDLIEADYDAAKAHCKPMKGNAQDVCEKQAKASYDKAMADSKAGQKMNEAKADAAKDKSEADYKVAKEKCDAMSGAAKDQCNAKAKVDHPR